MAASKPLRSLRICLDFGATFSTPKFIVDNGQPEKIRKFPTRLRYDPESKSEDSLTFVPPDEKPKGIVLSFKLLITQHTRFQNEDDKEVWNHVKTSITECDVMAGPEELVGRYIAGLWLYVYTLAGAHVPKVNVHTVITHPAVYDHGFIGSITFETENQAASMCIQQELDLENEVLVVDCGGMSIDAAYANTPPGVIRKPYSALGGGVFLDRLFERAVENKLPQASGPEHAGIRKNLKSTIMGYWNTTIKPGFTGSPVSSHRRLWTHRDLTINILDQDIRPAFVTTAARICKLIKDVGADFANKDSPKHVILTGGLASSVFIHSYLRRELKDYRIETHKNPSHAVIDRAKES